MLSRTIDHLLDSKADNASSNLDGLRLINLKFDWLLREDERTKFRQVILQVVIVRPLRVVFENGVAATDGNVTHAKIALVASAHFELGVGSVRHDNVHHPTGVLLKSQRLEPEEVLVLRDVHVDEAEAISV